MDKKTPDNFWGSKLYAWAFLLFFVGIPLCGWLFFEPDPSRPPRTDEDRLKESCSGNWRYQLACVAGKAAIIEKKTRQ
jgi:hypothetical protein